MIRGFLGSGPHLRLVVSDSRSRRSRLGSTLLFRYRRPLNNGMISYFRGIPTLNSVYVHYGMDRTEAVVLYTYIVYTIRSEPRSLCLLVNAHEEVNDELFDNLARPNVCPEIIYDTLVRSLSQILKLIILVICDLPIEINRVFFLTLQILRFKTREIHQRVQVSEPTLVRRWAGSREFWAPM